MSVIKTICSGTKRGLKWIAIQYAVIVGLALLYYLGLCVYSIFVDATVREILMLHPLGGHSFYTWQNGICMAIPIYTLLFGWWNDLFPERKHWWTYVLPWLVLMVVFLLTVVSARSWQFSVISIDEYLLGGWLAPLFGIAVQSIQRLLHSFQS